jgi:hypothetical protein
MARHVTIRRTKTTTEELHAPWVYRAQGALGTLAVLGVLLFVWWWLASVNCC